MRVRLTRSIARFTEDETVFIPAGSIGTVDSASLRVRLLQAQPTHRTFAAVIVQFDCAASPSEDFEPSEAQTRAGGYGCNLFDGPWVIDVPPADLEFVAAGAK